MTGVSDRSPDRHTATDLRTEVAVVALYSALAVAFTWPVAPHFFTHLPTVVADPPFVSWTLSWQAHALLNDPLALFDAPIFYPFDDALLLSETMVGAALMGLPFWVATHSPPAMFNIVVLASFPISAYGAYRLLLDITDSRWGAIAAGIAFGFSMYRVQEIAVLHIGLIMWIPYVLFFLRRFVRERRWSYAWGTAGFAWLQLVSSGHGALVLELTLLIVVPMFVIVWTSRFRDRTLWIRGGTAAAALVVAALPLVLPYVRLYDRYPEFRRGPEEVEFYSTGPGGFLEVTERSRTYASKPFRPIVRAACGGDDACVERTERDALFPGFAVLAVSAGALSLWRSRKREERAWLVVFGLMAVVGAALSVGTDTSLGGPYGLAYRFVPQLDTIRVPGRITILTTLGLAGLVGLAVSRLTRQDAGSRSRMREVAAIAVCVLLLVDVAPTSADAERALPVPPMYERLAASGRRTPMLELPTAEYWEDRGRLAGGTLRREVDYLYYQTRHWLPIVNGYSGNVPPSFLTTVRAVRGFPDARSIERLTEIGVGCVIVHRDRIVGTPWADVEADLRRYDRTVVLDDGERFVVDLARLRSARGLQGGPVCGVALTEGR